MADYLYHTHILKDSTDTLGYDLTTESNNKSDFENNYKSQAIEVQAIIPGATTFEVEKSYTDFKNFIDGITIAWSNVKYSIDGKFYTLYLVSQTAL